jgi:hypothetical protein
MKKDTVELIFSPHASSYGHMYVRVGDRLLDLHGPWGARNDSFKQQIGYGSSAMYGFTFKVGKKRVASLLTEYKKLISSNPKFDEYGSGKCFSCASFVTSILQSHAPELMVRNSVSAIGVGASLLRSSKVDGVTLYRAAANKASNSDFSFDKID